MRDYIHHSLHGIFNKNYWSVDSCYNYFEDVLLMRIQQITNMGKPWKMLLKPVFNDKSVTDKRKNNAYAKMRDNKCMRDNKWKGFSAWHGC